MKIGFASAFLCASLICGQTAASTNAGEQSEQLTIKDAAEYSAYIKALQTANPIDEAQQLDRFLGQYPNTVVKAEVLKAELHAYQQVKNEDEVVRTAERLLECEPNNLYLSSRCSRPRTDSLQTGTA